MDRLFAHHPAALAPAAAAALAAWVRHSGHLGQSQLRGTFRASRGFGLTFTDDNRADLLERFPRLALFLSLCPAKSPFLPHRRPNAFYLNALFLEAGAGVGLHVDSTLGEPVGDEQKSPEVVTVLYLETPAAGGRLDLFLGRRPVLDLTPGAGDLLHFRGDLGHRVTPVTAGARLSLVLEQYDLTPAERAGLPGLVLHSRGDRVYPPTPPGPGFDRVLARKRKTGVPGGAKAE